VESLKTRGVQELEALRKRVRKSRAMGRISKSDYDFLEERLDEIEARIVAMTEISKEGMEVDHGWE
jgi:hypothetical protein